MGFYDGNQKPEADHDPTKDIQWEIAGIARSIGRDLTAVVTQLIDAAVEAIQEQIKDVVDTLVGYVTDPENFLEDLAEWGVNILAGGGASDFIPDWIPLSSIIESGVNLLIGGLFETVGSIAEGGDWSWTDLFATGTSAGSATVTHDGSLQQLFSKPPIKVAPGQNVTLKQGVRWQGVGALVGTAFSLGAQFLNAAQAPLGSVTTVATIANPTNNSSSMPGVDPNGFVEMAASTTVPPGASYVRQVLEVKPLAATGQSWWSNASFEKVSVPNIFSGFLDPGGFISDVFDAAKIGNITQLIGIPPQNILGITAGTIVETFETTINRLFSGFLRLPGSSGKSISDVEDAAAGTSAAAQTALEVGEWNNALLGVRNNKSLMEGMDETEESNFLLTDLFSNGTDPVGVISATSAAVPMAFWRGTELTKKGVISWFGKGFASITALFIDIYKFNFTTNSVVLLHSSSDQIGQVTASWSLCRYVMPTINRFDVTNGDIIGIAWRVTGAGTHSIAGKLAGSWLPVHPSVVPAKPAAVRTGVGNMSFATLAGLYSGNVPWFGIGIATGDITPPYHAARETSITDVGAFSYVIPDWADEVDEVHIGAGGGGRGGDPITLANGEGGDAGEWSGRTLVRGVDFPAGPVTLTGVIGAGGSLGGWPNGSGGTGGATTRAAIAGGSGAVSTPGGPGGNVNNNTPGDTPTPFTFNGRTYTGGAGGNTSGGNNGQPGSPPGAGGGGGAGGTWGIAWNGATGARGGAWYTARQVD